MAKLSISRGTMADADAFDLRVLLTQDEEGWWVAQGLDLDIAAQARKLSDLREEFEKALITNCAIHEAEGLDPFKAIGPAPDHLIALYENNAVAEIDLYDGHFAASPAGRLLPQPHFRVAEAVAA